MEPELENVSEELKILLLQLPNIPFDDVPVGKDDSQNVVLNKSVNRRSLILRKKIIWPWVKVWI